MPDPVMANGDAAVVRRGRRTVIPGRQAMSDTHGELYFARFDARNRLVTGGAVIGPGNKAERIETRVAKRLQRLWPQIGPVQFDYVWNGYVGIDTDFLPAFIASGPMPSAGPAATAARSRLPSHSATNYPRRCAAFRKRISRCRSADPVPIVAHGLLRHVAPLMLMLYRWRDAREIA